MERRRRERCVRVTLVVQDARRRHDKTSVAASQLQLLRNESHGLTPVATGMSPLRGSVRKRLRRAFSCLQVSKLQSRAKARDCDYKLSLTRQSPRRAEASSSPLIWVILFREAVGLGEGSLRESSVSKHRN